MMWHADPLAGPPNNAPASVLFIGTVGGEGDPAKYSRNMLSYTVDTVRPTAHPRSPTELQIYYVKQKRLRHSLKS
jgi:hypothetical protein